MLITYKIKHGRDFSTELNKARQVAEFALANPGCGSSSALVKHIGLHSGIACQILRKYGRDKKTKKISNVKLGVTSQGIINKSETKTLWIPSLNLSIPYTFSGFTKINHMELDNNYAYIVVTVQENQLKKVTSWLGVDLNATGHCCVAANPTTGKVLKLGKSQYHTRTKYKNQRKKLKKNKNYKELSKIDNRESRVTKNINHKISRKVVDYAVENNAGIVLEDLKGISDTGKSEEQERCFRKVLHSWSYAQLTRFIEYKAKLLGIPVVKIDPRYTSQQCSKCGNLGTRNRKHFKCQSCGHVEDADVNAAFVIALRHQGILRLPTDRDVGKGSTDTPSEATA